MGGKDFQEEVMLAAVRPLKAANSTMPEGPQPIPLRQLSVEDSDSLEGLFQRHHDRVFRTAHRVTGSAADAEDVLQTVFLRVARGQESVAAAENPEAYFARAAIIRELLIDALSKLGDTAAQMFALRYFEGFGNGEIANVMHTSPLVVGVTLHRARVRLRKEIGKYLQKHST